MKLAVARTAFLVLALAGCAFATKHPAATAGIVGGTMGFSSCWIAVEKLDTCGKVGGVIGGGLFLVTFLATTFLQTDADDDSEASGGMQRVPGQGMPEGPYLPPEPNPLPATALPDAGVPAVPVDAAPVPQTPGDAATGADAPAAP
jgi:hypothetical protein